MHKFVGVLDKCDSYLFMQSPGLFRVKKKWLQVVYMYVANRSPFTKSEYRGNIPSLRSNSQVSQSVNHSVSQPVSRSANRSLIQSLPVKTEISWNLRNLVLGFILQLLIPLLLHQWKDLHCISHVQCHYTNMSCISWCAISQTLKHIDKYSNKDLHVLYLLDSWLQVTLLSVPQKYVFGYFQVTFMYLHNWLSCCMM